MFTEILNRTFLGNTPDVYLTSTAVFIGGVLIARVFHFLVIRRMKARAGRTGASLDFDFLRSVEKPLMPLLYLTVLYFSVASFIVIPARALVIARGGYIAVATFLAIRIASSVIGHSVRRYWERKTAGGEGDVKSIQGISSFINFLLQIIEGVPETEFGRAHFRSFGDSSLDFTVVYHVNSPDYDAYLDIQQTINLNLMRAFEKEGIEFAFPTRTVRLEKAT